MPSLDWREYLFRNAYFELGQQHGYYLSDIPYIGLRFEEKLRLTLAAKEAAKTGLRPERTKDGWVFVDHVNRRGV